MAEAVLERKPPLAWISLNRPEKLNAINDDMAVTNASPSALLKVRNSGISRWI